MQREFIAQVLPVYTVFAFILGAVVGSFLNVVVWRLPRGESLSHPGSHCPKCHHAIRPWENIPIVSWLMLRGKCSNCGLPISIRYPVVELVNGLLYLIVWYHIWTAGMPVSAFWGYAFLMSSLLAATLIDVEHLLIPDAITFSGMIVAVGLAAVFPVTHLGPGITGLPGSDQLVTGALLDYAGALGEWIRGMPRLAAGVDAAVGIAVGYSMLWLLLEAGRRLWGRVSVKPDEPCEAVLTAEGIRIDEAEFDASWDDILVRPSDAFRAEAETLSAADGADFPADDGRARHLTVRNGVLSVGDRQLDLEQVGDIRASLRFWQFPREVMGYGDVKLLAMIGAFMGPDACVFVLMIGAFAGCLWGLLRVLAGHGRQLLPFGPFLAGAAFLWFLFGTAFVRWYGSWLRG